MTAFVLSAVFAVVAPVPKGATEEPKEITAAREKAIDFLKKQQNKDGNWEGLVLGFLADMDGGSTALAALGLLEAGVKPDDAAITKAVDYLVKLEPKKTYVVSLQTQVLARVDANKFDKQIQANADWLLKNALGWQNGKGKLQGWSYPQNQIPDNSNTHFAVMGLHAAAKAGAKIDATVWAELRALYTRTRTQDGWTYYNDRNERATVSMTACGLLGLAIAAKYDKNAPKPDPDFDKGMAAYVAMWRLESLKSTMYNLMVIAELGRALDVKEFKSGKQTRAWYKEGVEKLVEMQKEDGSFIAGKSVDGIPVLGTAFGLYFLGPPPKK